MNIKSNPITTMIIFTIISLSGFADSHAQSSANANKGSGSTRIDTKSLSDIAFCFEALARLKSYWEPGNSRYIQKNAQVYKDQIAPIETNFINCVGNDQSRREICVAKLSSHEIEIAKSVGAGRTVGHQLASSQNQSAKAKIDLGNLKVLCSDGPVGK